ncbi:MAG: DUF2213 domain-containing protein [Betaproteobacteria bacterium]|nr:MAG: DUF2213 domain-containing protein [Betaproteobacteria bacterium]
MRNIDYIPLNDAADNYEIMPNGFLSIMALLTRTGVFNYQKIDPDGTVHVLRQLRLPDEVFSEETLASMSGMPLTNNHPEELLNPENAADYIVGMASDNPKRVKVPVQGDDEDYVQQKLTFMDAGIIDLILSGDKKELSLGYTCELEMKDGLYNGIPYNCIQRNIRINHGSLVPRARGGQNCKVLLDGQEQVVNLDGIIVEDKKNNTRECNLKIFTHGGKEYKVEDDVHALLTNLQSENVTAGTQLDSKSKELEKLTGVCDDLKSQIKVQKDSDDTAAFSEKVRARVSLESKATEVLGKEVALDGLSDREIKEKVVCKLRPGVNLDGRNDDYVDGRFEMSIEDHTSSTNTDSDDAKNLGNNILNKDGADSAVSKAEKARADAWERDRNLWKGGK